MITNIKCVFQLTRESKSTNLFSEMYSVNIKQLSKLILGPLKARQAALIMGAHGIGKSALVHELGKTLAKSFKFEDEERYGEDYEFPVIDYRLSQLEDAGDLIGLPYKERVVTMGGPVDLTNFAPMQRFYQACEMPCILFFDELDRANNAVRQAAFQASGARALQGIKFHPDTVLIAATNSNPETGGQYSVNGFDDPAEFDRWVPFYLIPEPTEHLKYLQNHLSADIWNFLKRNPSHLSNSSLDYKENKVYPSPRSWEKLGKALAQFDSLEPQEFIHICQSYIGHATANELQNYLSSEVYLTPNDILGGNYAEAPRLRVDQLRELKTAFVSSGALKKRMTQKKIDNLLGFLKIIPREQLQVYWIMIMEQNRSLGQRIQAKLPELGKLSEEQ